jgi:hypothetical protein
MVVHEQVLDALEGKVNMEKQPDQFVYLNLAYRM